MKKAKQKTVWFGMKLTPEQKDKIKQLARRRGVSQKQAVMDLIEHHTRQLPDSAPENSFLNGVEHLSGSVSGPSDLSTNPTYMDGFGR
jgi:predicted DNA-binding protein